MSAPRTTLVPTMSVRLSCRSAYTPAGALSRTLGSVYAIISTDCSDARWVSVYMNTSSVNMRNLSASCEASCAPQR